MGRRRTSGFTLVELLVVIIIIGLLAALLLPAIVKALCSARQGAASEQIKNLGQAAKMYDTDFGVYPQSTASFDSSSLAKALKSTGPKKQSYYEFQPGDLDGSENVISRVRSTELLKYRNNKNNPPNAAAKNKQSFDMWCPDCNNIPDAVNNWGGN